MSTASQPPAPDPRARDSFCRPQERYDALDEQYEAEERALELKYRALFEPLFAERAQVVAGGQPAAGAAAAAAEAGGVPDFWLKAIQNHEARERTNGPARARS